MASKDAIDQATCDKYREPIYQDLKKMREEISEIRGAHKLAVIISPIIVTVIVTLSSVAFASYINSQILTQKVEILQKIETLRDDKEK